MNTHLGPHRRLWMGPQFQFKHYSEATVSVCHPNSNVFTADLPQTSMNIVDADLKSLPYVCLSKSNQFSLYFLVRIEFNGRNRRQYMYQVHIKTLHQRILSVYGSSFDSLKSDFEVELVEKLADAAVDISLRNGDATDSLTSSTCSNSVVRPVLNHHSLENLIPFPDTSDSND